MHLITRMLDLFALVYCVSALLIAIGIVCFCGAIFVKFFAKDHKDYCNSFVGHRIFHFTARILCIAQYDKTRQKILLFMPWFISFCSNCGCYYGRIGNRQLSKIMFIKGYMPFSCIVYQFSIVPIMVYN